MRRPAEPLELRQGLADLGLRPQGAVGGVRRNDGVVDPTQQGAGHGVYRLGVLPGVHVGGQEAAGLLPVGALCVDGFDLVRTNAVSSEPGALSIAQFLAGGQSFNATEDAVRAQVAHAALHHDRPRADAEQHQGLVRHRAADDLGLRLPGVLLAEVGDRAHAAAHHHVVGGAHALRFLHAQAHQLEAVHEVAEQRAHGTHETLAHDRGPYVGQLRQEAGAHDTDHVVVARHLGHTLQAGVGRVRRMRVCAADAVREFNQYVRFAAPVGHDGLALLTQALVKLGHDLLGLIGVCVAELLRKIDRVLVADRLDRGVTIGLQVRQVELQALVAADYLLIRDVPRHGADVLSHDVDDVAIGEVARLVLAVQRSPIVGDHERAFFRGTAALTDLDLRGHATFGGADDLVEHVLGYVVGKVLDLVDFARVGAQEPVLDERLEALGVCLHADGVPTTQQVGLRSLPHLALGRLGVLEDAYLPLFGEVLEVIIDLAHELRSLLGHGVRARVALGHGLADLFVEFQPREGLRPLADGLLLLSPRRLDDALHLHDGGISERLDLGCKIVRATGAGPVPFRYHAAVGEQLDHLARGLEARHGKLDRGRRQAELADHVADFRHAQRRPHARENFGRRTFDRGRASAFCGGILQRRFGLLVIAELLLLFRLLLGLDRLFGLGFLQPLARILGVAL